jgi:NAD(P)-dependent dehydrogenase (short-subunit alcohol dehydrogenase family)
MKLSLRRGRRNAGSSAYDRLMHLDMFDLTGKVAVVTGGNSGIGLGMAQGLVTAGAEVCIWGTNEAKNAAALERLTEIRPSSSALICDVGDEQAVEAAMDSVTERYGPITTVFANAGVPAGSVRFGETELKDWLATTRINLDGVFLTFRAAGRRMIAQQTPGSLVVTSSLSARLGMPRGQAYSSTKGAVISLIQSIAVEYGKHGIRANALMPGWIETPMTDDLLGSERFDARNMPRMPLGRYGVPEDFAGIAVYLASDASRYHTGDTIRIDGGYGLT